MPIVYELPPEQFFRATPLFANAPFDEMFIDPALDGRQPARMFVDQAQAPRSAMLCRTYEFYLAGEPNAPDLRGFIRDAPAEIADFQHFHGFAPLDPAWIPLLEADFDGQLMVLPRINFRWPDNRFSPEWRSRVPAHVRIVPINAALAARIDTELGEHIGFFWSGYDRFEALGYGWCSLIGNQLGSVAVTDGADGRSVSIGVVTSPEFRRKGLAELTCRAFIADTLARGLQPVWECEVRNPTGSKYLAEKLGFVERNRFAQLSIAAPAYGPLSLSHGLWQAESGQNGIVAWRRHNPA